MSLIQAGYRARLNLHASETRPGQFIWDSAHCRKLPLPVASTTGSGNERRAAPQ